MQFAGPTPADYDNLRPLNRSYLALVTRDPEAGRLLADLPKPLAERCRTLAPLEAERLADTPFLLFSLHEDDDGFWTELMDGPAARDLFDERPSESLSALVDSALGFAWQLALGKPYALRLFTGATQYWCELISEQRLADLIERFRASAALPVPRLGCRTDIWRALLCGGTSPHHVVRHTVQTAALHAVLAGDRQPSAAAWPRAARRIAAPSLCVADENDPND